MPAPSERDKCQAKLDIMVDAFIRDDWAAYRDASIWPRDFAHQKNIERGRVLCGGNWFMPQKIEVVRKLDPEVIVWATARKLGGDLNPPGIAT